MWLLLVAAGSGYLARCWQNALKPRPALTDCVHISSSPETTPSNAASSAYGSPSSSRERRSGTNKEDANGSKKAQELRRQLSAGGRSFQARGLGKKLLYDTCGHSSSRFSRSESSSGGTEERKVFIESPKALSDEEDISKRKGACCGLASCKRSDITDCFVSPLTPTEGCLSISDGRCSEQSSQEPCADARGKEGRHYSICPRPTRRASTGQEGNTFEIPLCVIEEFSCQHTSPSLNRLSSPTHVRDTTRGLSGENLSREFAWMGPFGVSSRSYVATRTSGRHPSDTNGSKALDDLDVSKSDNCISNAVCVQDAGLGACHNDGQMHSTGENAEIYGEGGSPGSETAINGSLDISNKQGSAILAIKPFCDDFTLPYDTLQSAECEDEGSYQYQEQNVLDQADHCGSNREAENDGLPTRLDKLSVPSSFLNTSEGSAGAGSRCEHTGKILLSFLSGKRVKDVTKSSSRDGTEDSIESSLGKRKKDVSQGRRHAADQDPLSRNISSGLLDPSLGCLAFDATWFELQPGRDDKLKHGWMPRKIRTPSKSGRRSSTRKTRWLRGSAKVVSSLESCLRAQLLHDCEEIDEYRLPCDPAISLPEETVAEGDGLVQKVEESNMNTLQVSEQVHDRVLVSGDNAVSVSGIVECWLCKEPLCLGRVRGDCALGGEGRVPCNSNEGLSKNIQLPLALKKRKLSDAGQSPPSSGQLDRDMVVLPMDGLLFSFGVGVGVMSMVNTSKEEVEKIHMQLRRTEVYVESLKQELGLKDSYNRTNFSDVEECLQRGFPKVKITEDDKSGCNLSLYYSQEPSESGRSGGMGGVMESENQMAELEAELEAELQLMERNLTGESSSCHRRQFSGLSDLDFDGVPDVIEGDLKINGLPRPLDPDDDQIDSAHEDIRQSNWAVSPRDLDMRLQKVLIARQEESIAELESELIAAESKLISVENELQWWKDRFQKSERTCVPSQSEKNPLSLHYEEAIHEQNFSREKYLLGSGDIQVPEGMHNQHEWRQSIRASRSETGPAVDNHAGGVRSMVLSQSLVSETSSDDVCDEFLKAVKESSAVTENEKLVVSDALLLAEDGELVLNSEIRLGTGDYPVTLVTNCNTSTSYTDDCYGCKSVSSMVVQPQQVGDWADGLGPSRSAKEMESEMTQETWMPKRLYATCVTGAGDDFGANFHASRISRNNKRGPPSFSARLPGDESDSHGRARTRTAAVDTEMAPPPDNNCEYGHAPRSFSVGLDKESVKSVTACCTEDTSYRDLGPDSHAGANTPVDILLLQQSGNNAKDAEGVIAMESGTVMDKIRHWEGLTKGDTPPFPGVAIGKLSDWEAQSWTLESELVHPVVEDYSLWRENEVEATLGEILIKRIVEKTRRGSHIVREAQTVLATEYGDDLSESSHIPSACTLESNVHMAGCKNLSAELEDGMTCLVLCRDSIVRSMD